MHTKFSVNLIYFHFLMNQTIKTEEKINETKLMFKINLTKTNHLYNLYRNSCLKKKEERFV